MSEDAAIKRGAARVALKGGKEYENAEVAVYPNWVEVNESGLTKYFPREQVVEVFFE